ncbi:fimbrial usher protein FimD [Citrobacter koseri]|uniref:Fimbrial usher protein FimD n=1 Tax=Citrobacter koseri TaxID=545 RepID=A0A2X2YQH1_CITKO|nr:fimbrial usher protein FimD [Citrobacter koseri]
MMKCNLIAIFLRSAIDVSNYSQGNPVPQGQYNVDLYVNDKWRGRGEVKFENDKSNAVVAKPCFTLKLISTLGIDIDKIDPMLRQSLKNNESCVRIGDISSDLTAYYDVTTQRINVQAPQIWLLRQVRGYVNPELWITVFLLRRCNMITTHGMQRCLERTLCHLSI